jgi:PadR family transcriptional regulator PadR
MWLRQPRPASRAERRRETKATRASWPIGHKRPLTRFPGGSTVRGMVRGETRNPLTELRRGVLEHCVLAVLRENESYAFGIVRVLSGAGELVTSEGTIYPLLARLRRDGLVTTTWRESDAGPPRRYYRITDAGRRALDAFSGDWARFRDAVDALLGEASHGGDAGGR